MELNVILVGGDVLKYESNEHVIGTVNICLVGGEDGAAIGILGMPRCWFVISISILKLAEEIYFSKGTIILCPDDVNTL